MGEGEGEGVGDEKNVGKQRSGHWPPPAQKLDDDPDRCAPPIVCTVHTVHTHERADTWARGPSQSQRGCVCVRACVCVCVCVCVCMCVCVCVCVCDV